MGTASPRGGHGTHDLNHLDAGQPAPPPAPGAPSDVSICHQSCLLNTVDRRSSTSRACFRRRMRHVGSLCSGLSNQDGHHQVGSRMAVVEGKALPGLWSHLGATPWPCSCLQWPSPRLPPKPRWWGGGRGQRNRDDCCFLLTLLALLLTTCACGH